MKRKTFSFILAFLFILIIPGFSSAAPTTLVVGGGWQDFYWYDGLGPIDEPSEGYQVTSATPFRLKITDAFITGDAFQVYDDSGLILTTPEKSSVDLGIEDPNVAYGSADYSWGFIDLAAGTYNIDISLWQLTEGYSGGRGYISAEVAPVPIPAAVWLFGSGLLGLFGVRRKIRK